MTENESMPPASHEFLENSLDCCPPMDKSILFASGKSFEDRYVRARTSASETNLRVTRSNVFVYEFVVVTPHLHKLNALDL